MRRKYSLVGRTLSFFILLVALLLTVASCPPALAASSQATAKAGATDGEAARAAPQSGLRRYWVAGGEDAAPFIVAGTSSVTFSFRPHEAMCKSTYGADWYTICAPKTGLAGQTAREVALTPSVPGVWRWRSDMSLEFTPDKPLPPDTAFTVRLPANALPPNTEIVAPLSFRTQELMARMGGDFKFDPQNLKTLAVSGAIQFNYPVDRDSVVSRLKFVPAKAQGGKADALYGKPAITWDNSLTTLRFSVPVLAFPEEDTSLNVTMDAGYMARSGGTPGKGMDFHVDIPTKKSLFQLDRASSGLVVGENLRARQLLTLEFSLPALAEEVLPAVKVVLLPRQRIAVKPEPDAPYRWVGVEELSPEVMAQAVPVKLVPESAGEASRVLTFSFDKEIEAGRTLLVTMQKEVKGTDGEPMTKNLMFLTQVARSTDALQIMQKGQLLALTGEKTLSIYSRNMDAVRYTVSQVRPEYLSLFVSSTGGGFQSGSGQAFQSAQNDDDDRYERDDDYDDRYSYDEDDYHRSSRYGRVSREQFSIVSSDTIPLLRRDSLSAQFSSLDLGQFLKNGQKGLFNIRLEGMLGKTARGSDERFILVTDLGLIRKSMADGSSIVYAASLGSGKPQKGVTVKVLGANGLPVFEGRTDEDGRVNVPSLSGMKQEKEPVAFVATAGDDLAFLPYAASGRELNYSRFDVGGVRTTSGLVAFAFGERGLYRPGETVHFGYIVKRGDWKEQKLDGLPLRVVINDPRGNEVLSRKVTLPAGGMGDVSYPLLETAATGTYNFELRLDSGEKADLVLQSATFRVEEFQPDTMRLTVRMDPAPSKGWLRPKDVTEALTARVNLMNLFGTPAADRTVNGTMDILRPNFHFKEYSDWTFYDAAALGRESSQRLDTETTDAKGDAVWTIKPDQYEKESCRLVVNGEGMDAAGGRSVKASASVLVSPLDVLVGWKTGSNLGYLRQGGEASLDLLAIGPDLSPKDFGALTLETVDVFYVKTLIRDDRGQYRYDRVRQQKVLGTKKVDLSAKGLLVPLDVSGPGTRMLVARDNAGKIVLSVNYVVAGNAPATYGEDREPMFTVRTNKADYAPGEEMEIYLSTPYKGAGLITVERDTVVAQTWFMGNGGDMTTKLRLPAGFEGKAYLNVMYFRALDDKDIFTRPLASYVVPFQVNMDARDLKITLKPLPNAPAVDSAEGAASAGKDIVVRPGGTFPVEVSAQRPCKAVIYAVDEGILQMTSYKVPNPLRALLGDRALQVSTSQYFDMLMPEYSLMRGALSAYGGGEGLNFAAMGQNPFRRPGDKMAVFWSGIVDVGPNPTKIDVPIPPAFSGQMRIMAVACSTDGVSAGRSDVKSQAEVVIQPSMPLFVTPGDEFETTVALTDMSGLAPKAPAAGGQTPGNAATPGRDVKLSVRTEPGLKLVSALPDNLSLYNAQEKVVKLRFRAMDSLGGSTVTFVVEPAAGKPGNAVQRPMGLSVRPAMPRGTDVLIGRIRADVGADKQETVLPFSRKLYPQYASFSVGVSPLPLPAVRGLMDYLRNYPYGCTEQLTSAGFPALMMLRYREFAPQEKAYSEETLRKYVGGTLDRLAGRYQGNGDFALWPGGSSGDLFLTAYVGDFLVTAKEMGILVPYTLERNTLDKLRRSAAEPPSDMTDARVKAYASWVLTRSGVVTSNNLATLTAWLNRYAKDWNSDITTVFMAGCWKMMQQQKEADRLLDAYKPVPSKEWRYSNGLSDFDELLNRAFYLTVVAGQFPERLGNPEIQAVLDEVMDMAQARRYVTISAAQTARALTLYSKSLKSGVLDSGLTARNAAGKSIAWTVAPSGSSLVKEASMEAPEPAAGGNAALYGLTSVALQTSGPMFWQMTSTGFDRELPAKAVQAGMELKRELRTPEGKPAAAIKVGDEVIMVIKARVFGKPMQNIAITDLLPGGFEMIVAEGGDSTEIATDKGRASDAAHRQFDQDMAVDYAERREDRLLLFPSLGTGETVFRYRARATVPGTYVLPPLYGEAMYNPTIRAWSDSGKVVVEGK